MVPSTKRKPTLKELTAALEAQRKLTEAAKTQADQLEEDKKAIEAERVKAVADAEAATKSASEAADKVAATAAEKADVEKAALAARTESETLKKRNRAYEQQVQELQDQIQDDDDGAVTLGDEDASDGSVGVMSSIASPTPPPRRSKSHRESRRSGRSPKARSRSPKPKSRRHRSHSDDDDDESDRSVSSTPVRKKADTVRLKPPAMTFDGKKREYRTWRRLVSEWQTRHKGRHSSRRLGSELLDAITGEARLAVLALVPEGTVTLRTVLEAMDATYGIAKLPRLLQALRKLRGCVRGREPYQIFLTRYAGARSEALAAGVPLTTIDGLELLEAAMLSDVQLQSLLSTFTKAKKDLPTYGEVKGELESLAEAQQVCSVATRGANALFSRDGEKDAKGRDKGDKGKRRKPEDKQRGRAETPGGGGGGGGDRSRSRGAAKGKEDKNGKGHGKGRGKGADRKPGDKVPLQCHYWQRHQDDPNEPVCPYGEKCRFMHCRESEIPLKPASKKEPKEP